MTGILVLHPGSLGDIVLALPALTLLRDRFPGIPLTLAGNTDFLPAIARGYAERATALSTVPLHRLYSPEPLPPDDARFWNSYDRIIAWTGFGDPVFRDRLNRLSPENVLAGWRPGPAESRHVSRIFVDTLRPWLGEVANIPLPRIAVAPEDQNAANQWLDGRDWPDGHAIVAVHPGAGNLDKRWSGYAALVEQLACQGGYRVVVIEGPAEPGSGAVVRRRLPSDRVAVASSLSLELLAGVLSRCAGYIGNDSGISHLAAGLGVTSVVLFGPTAPGIWGPLGGHVEILRDTRGCRACDNPSSPEHRCLDNIRPEAVLERFAALRARTAG